MEAVFLSGMNSQNDEIEIESRDIAATITASLSHGWQNFGTNGAIECKKL